MLSGNRNFEGRINSDVRANYLMSPPLVVAFAIAGRIDIDLDNEPLGHRPGRAAGVPQGHLADASSEIEDACRRSIRSRDVPAEATPRCSRATSAGRRLTVPAGDRFAWEDDSTYVTHAAVLRRHAAEAPAPVADITGARVLALLGDSVTTDHISPAGSIKKDSPAGQYLHGDTGWTPKDFNSYGARRGNHEVMVRGTFANVRIRNQLAPGIHGE